MYEMLLGVIKKKEVEINILTKNNRQDILLEKSKLQSIEEIRICKTTGFYMSICVFMYVQA